MTDILEYASEQKSNIVYMYSLFAKEMSEM